MNILLTSYDAGYQIGYQVGYVFGALFVSALLGLIPFFLGRKRDLNVLAITGLLACIAAGIIYPGSALLMAIIFSVIILIKGR